MTSLLPHLLLALVGLVSNPIATDELLVTVVEAGAPIAGVEATLGWWDFQGPDSLGAPRAVGTFGAAISDERGLLSMECFSGAKRVLFAAHWKRGLGAVKVLAPGETALKQPLPWHPW